MPMKPSLMATAAVLALAPPAQAQSFLESLARRGAEAAAARARPAVEQRLRAAITGERAPGAAPGEASPGESSADASVPAASVEGGPSGRSRPSAAPQRADLLVTDRFAQTALLAFWRSHGPGTTLGDDPSRNAPGWFRNDPVLHLHQPASGERITQAQAEALKRKLDVAFRALMSQPSLQDIRGASLNSAINVSVVPTSSGVRLIGATLSFNAKPLRLGEPETFLLDGRYNRNEGEGDVLHVHLNPYEFVYSRDPIAEGVAGRIVALRAGSTRGLYVQDDHFDGEWDPREQAARLETDQSWHAPGAPGTHPLLVTFSGGRHTNQALAAGQLEPTAPIARLAAAVYMTDWDAVQREMAVMQ